MPRLRVDNPTVNISISNGESVTVPTGEQWQVQLLYFATDTNGRIELNGGAFLDSGKRILENYILFGGDTLSSVSAKLKIRGYQVEP